MNFKPILFSTPMIKAIKNGTKTQTRRIIKPQPIFSKDLGWCIDGNCYGIGFSNSETEYNFVSGFSKIQVDDILWVRETFCAAENFDHWSPSNFNESYEFNYKADQDNDEIPKFLHRGRWRPSIHMPKIACRIFLLVTAVRVERLHNISNEDAKAEGIENHHLLKSLGFKHYTQPQKIIPFHAKNAERNSFFSLWMSINGAESLDANPWVWVYEFEQIKKPENF